jgi:hypothetical protein
VGKIAKEGGWNASRIMDWESIGKGLEGFYANLCRVCQATYLAQIMQIAHPFLPPYLAYLHLYLYTRCQTDTRYG